MTPESPLSASGASGKSVSVSMVTKCASPWLNEYHMLLVPLDAANGIWKRALYAEKLLRPSRLCVSARHAGEWHSLSWFPTATI